MKLIKQSEVILTNYLKHVRSPMMHVSDVTSYMQRQESRNRRSPLFSLGQMRRFQEMGWLWEAIIGLAVRKMIAGNKLKNRMSQVETVRDGLALTPDDVALYEGHIVEYKGTLTSADKGILHPKFHWWHVRTMAYCYHYGMKRAVYYVWHVRGDYKDFAPITRRYVVRYTDSGMRQNWRMLLNNAPDAAKACGKKWKRS